MKCLPSRTAYAWLGAALLSCPVFGQSNGAAEHQQTANGDETSMEVVEDQPLVVWDGLRPDNYDVDEFIEILGEASAAVTARGGGADDVGKAAVGFLNSWQKSLLDKFDAFVKPIDPRSNPREQAYTMLNSFVGTGFMGAGGILLGGAGIGTVCGAAVSVGSKGTLAVAALPAGIAIGTGAGAAGGAATIAGTTLAAMVLAGEIERRYPYERYQVTSRGDAGDDSEWEDEDVPEEWVAAELQEELEVGTAEASVGTRGKSQRKRSSRYAGPQESLFIHLIAEVLSPQVRDLARNFDKASGLSRSQRRQLKKYGKPLQQLLQKLDYIRVNKRYSKRSPEAMPLSTWQKRVRDFTLKGDTKALRRLWTDAIKIGNTSIEVNGRNVTWHTPRALRAAGARKSYRIRLPKMSPRVVTPAGTLQASVTPRKFKIRLGSVKTRNGGFSIGFSVRSKTKLATVKLSAIPPVGPKLERSFSPRLGKTLKGEVRFKPAGAGFALDTVKLSGMSMSFAFPNLGPLSSAPGFKDLRKKFEKAVSDHLRKIFRKSDWGKLFNGVADASVQQLLDVLNKTADQHGLAMVEGFRGMRFDKRGRMSLRVDARKWHRVPGLSKRDLARVQKTFR